MLRPVANFWHGRGAFCQWQADLGGAGSTHPYRALLHGSVENDPLVDIPFSTDKDERKDIVIFDQRH